MPDSATLTRAQRSHLIRSTRKLSALLGETPTIEVAELSLTGSTSSSWPTAPRPLSSFNLHPAFDLSISADAYATVQHDSQPSTPTHCSLNRDSPCRSRTPLPLMDGDSIEMRRKRLAKLSRTFGEPIPPELVTSTGRQHLGLDDTVDDIAQHYISESESTESEEAFYHERPAFGVKTRSKSHRLSEVSSVSSLSSDSPPPSYTTLGRSSSLMVTSTRSRSKHSHTLSENLLSGRKDDQDLAFTTLNYQPKSYNRRSKVDQTYRSQKGWSGEWNRDDMDQVLKKLRMLK